MIARRRRLIQAPAGTRSAGRPAWRRMPSALLPIRAAAISERPRVPVTMVAASCSSAALMIAAGALREVSGPAIGQDQPAVASRAAVAGVRLGLAARLRVEPVGALAGRLVWDRERRDATT